MALIDLYFSGYFPANYLGDYWPVQTSSVVVEGTVTLAATGAITVSGEVTQVFPQVMGLPIGASARPTPINTGPWGTKKPGRGAKARVVKGSARLVVRASLETSTEVENLEVNTRALLYAASAMKAVGEAVIDGRVRLTSSAKCAPGSCKILIDGKIDMKSMASFRAGHGEVDDIIIGVDDDMLDLLMNILDDDED